MKQSFIILSIMMAATAFATQAQTVIPLYAGKVPNSRDVPDPEVRAVDNTGNVHYSKTSIPTLEIRLAPQNIATGTAVIICPGGGYTYTSYTHEGTKIAEAFNKMGVSAFILKYRMPSDDYIVNKTIAPLQDAQTAIKIVRMRAGEWGVDTAKVGIIGFSAGGHLASTAGTHFDRPVIDNPEKISLRPSFMILVYPVLDLSDSLMHKGSRNNLLGPTPSAEMIKLYSANYQVSKQTPPTFIVHAGDDKTVKVQNSIEMYMALLKNGVPAEMHIYPKGGHGFGINGSNTGHWIDRAQDWMKANGWIK